jgi:hypothetical protein
MKIEILPQKYYFNSKKLCHDRGSNWGHLDLQPNSLPTELPGYSSKFIKYCLIQVVRTQLWCVTDVKLWSAPFDSIAEGSRLFLWSQSFTCQTLEGAHHLMACQRGLAPVYAKLTSRAYFKTKSCNNSCFQPLLIVYKSKIVSKYDQFTQFVTKSLEYSKVTFYATFWCLCNIRCRDNTITVPSCRNVTFFLSF